MKLHLAVDTITGRIATHVLTEGTADDAAQVPDLLRQVEGTLVSLTVDGAYDGEPIYAAAQTRQPNPPPEEVVTPSPPSAALSTNELVQRAARDRHFRLIAERGRMGWQKTTRYGRRALAETVIGRYKHLIGSKHRTGTELASRVRSPWASWRSADPGRQARLRSHHVTARPRTGKPPTMMQPVHQRRLGGHCPVKAAKPTRPPGRDRPSRHVTTVMVGDLLRRCMPNGPQRRGTAIGGTVPDEEWRRAPWWPPDLFCVAATLVEASGCYADPGLLFSRNEAERLEKRRRGEAAAEAGKQWRADGITPVPVCDAWFRLLAGGSEPVCSGFGRGAEWKLAALELMAMADEACRDIGFVPAKGSSNETARIALNAIANAQQSRDDALHMPVSLCCAVPPDVACVLPKVLTPDVGCTLRSLSLNLALLPSVGQVGAEWFISTEFARSASEPGGFGDGPFNLLLIPFPYHVLAADFCPAGPTAGGGADGYFGLRQGWLPEVSSRQDKVAELVAALIESAQAEGDEVHGVVLPETALAAEMADPLAGYLAARFPALELLICGTLGSEADHAINEAAVVRVDSGKPVAIQIQKKHHRWRLTPAQIRQYRLERSLPGEHDRWERIDVSGRRLQFGVNRRDAVVAALVCEDLARFDPVLPVLNAVGPNLIVALLMDGPQLVSRWPGRYATVLAEDPGSSVLTLTCLGMLKRSRRPEEGVNRCIALWKDAGGGARELVLPEGAHALLLSLDTIRRDQKTLDLRTEQDVVTYRYHGVRDVELPWTAKFAWLGRPPNTT